jgi:hypothetical protein
MFFYLFNFGVCRLFEQLYCRNNPDLKENPKSILFLVFLHLLRPLNRLHYLYDKIVAKLKQGKKISLQITVLSIKARSETVKT